MPVELFQDQLKERGRIGAAMLEERNVVFCAPCGWGKTHLFCSMADGAAKKGKTICIAVHRIELLDQTSRTLEKFDVNYGVIAAGRSENPRATVQVASILTLAKRLDRWPHFDLLVADESHHVVSPTWSRVVRNYPKAFVLGVTATPQRLDGRGLGDFFKKMVVGPSVADLMANGRLSRAVVYAPRDPVDLHGVHTRMSDYDKKELGSLMGQSVVVGDAVEHYKRLATGELAIAFCVSVMHAEAVATQFREAGIPSQSIDGRMSPAKRKATLAEFERGEIKVLTSCDLISEGLDVPSVGAAILLRPTKSLALAIQQMGRALRVSPGKTRALILDHANLCFMHGLPDEDREWTLEGAPKKKKKAEDSGPTVKQCQSCWAMARVSARECPACGAPFEIKARVVEHVDGELAEIDAAELRRRKRREEGRAHGLEELRALAKARGYKDGWAEIRWKARLRKMGARA